MENNPLKSASAIVEVLLIGEQLPTDEQAISATVPPCRLTCVNDVAQALAALQSGTSVPALMVVVQNWPSQVSATDVDRLRAAAPLARICGLLGTWCEGETRSGKPWPGAVRCYWHQWPARFHQEIAAMAAGRSSVWSLPPTASAEEQLLSAVPPCSPKRQGLLAIIAENAETAAALADAAQMRGYKTVALRSPRGAQISGAAATLWDARPEVVASPAAISEVLSAVEGTPLIALVSFPRAEIVARAKSRRSVGDCVKAISAYGSVLAGGTTGSAGLSVGAGLSGGAFDFSTSAGASLNAAAASPADFSSSAFSAAGFSRTLAGESLLPGTSFDFE